MLYFRWELCCHFFYVLSFALDKSSNYYHATHNVQSNSTCDDDWWCKNPIMLHLNEKQKSATILWSQKRWKKRSDSTKKWLNNKIRMKINLAKSTACIRQRSQSSQGVSMQQFHLAKHPEMMANNSHIAAERIMNSIANPLLSSKAPSEWCDHFLILPEFWAQSFKKSSRFGSDSCGSKSNQSGKLTIKPRYLLLEFLPFWFTQ